MEFPSVQFCASKKIATLEYLRMLDMQENADYTYQMEYLNQLYEKLFEVLFKEVEKRYQKLYVINYSPASDKYLPIYKEKIENLKKDLVEFRSRKVIELEKFFAKYKIDIENIIAKNARKIEGISSSVFDFEQTINTLENSIFEASNSIRRIYKQQFINVDDELKQRIENMNKESAEKREKLVDEYKQNLIDVMNPQPVKVKSLESLNMEIVILRSEKDKIKERYYDVITSYNAYKRYPKRMLGELMSMLNISNDKGVKDLIDKIKEDSFTITGLYLKELQQSFRFHEEEFCFFMNALNERNDLYNQLCLLYRQGNSDEDNFSNVLKRKKELFDDCIEEFKEKLDAEYDAVKAKRKFDIDSLQKEFNDDYEFLKRMLEKTRREALDDCSIRDDFTVDDYKEEYERLEKELKELESNEIVIDKTSFDDKEIEMLEYQLAVDLTKDCVNEINSFKEKIAINDNLDIILMNARIVQQKELCNAQIKAFNEYANERISSNNEWIEKLNNHIESIHAITEKTVVSMNQEFANEKKELETVHFNDKLRLFNADKEVCKSLKKLEFIKNKCSLSDDMYISFLERQVRVKQPEILSPRLKRIDDQIKEIFK